MSKNRGGRPTKYREEFNQRVDEYLETCGKKRNKLPKEVDLAIMFDVAEKTLYEWAKKHPKFRKSLDKILNAQKVQLLDDGIYGGKEVNTTIIKLQLMNNHEYKDRTENEQNVRIEEISITRK